MLALRSVGRYGFRRVALSAGGSPQGAALMHGSDRAAGRELGAAGTRTAPEPWPCGHLPGRASGEKISAAAQAAPAA